MTLKIDKKIVGYEVVDISQPQKKSATGKKDLVEEKKEEGAIGKSIMAVSDPAHTNSLLLSTSISTFLYIL